MPIADIQAKAAELRAAPPRPARAPAARVEPQPQTPLDLSPIRPDYPILPSGRIVGPLPEPIEQPPIPLKNVEPAATQPIKPVEGASVPEATKHHTTMQQQFGFMPPKAYQDVILNHDYPTNAISSDAALVKHLKERGVTKKTQFNGASQYQQDTWGRQADINRGKLPKNIKPMSDETRARINLLLE